MKGNLAVLGIVLAGLAHAQGDGRRLFTSGAGGAPACALCHALKDAGAEGAIGPSLDELKPDAARVAKAMKNGIGQMPAFTQLSDAQVEALSRYVETASRK